MPEMLFVGGPLDGKRISVAVRCLRVPVIPKTPIGETWLDSVSYDVVDYVPLAFKASKNTPVQEVMCPVGMIGDEVFKLLIDNYRPKEKR